VWELRFARADSISLALPTNSTSISYQKLQGWNVSTGTYAPTQTISFNANQITLNGVAIAEGVKALTFNRSGSTITVAVEVEKTVAVGAENRVYNRRLEVQVTL
jgi:hypothetical protein